MCRHFAYVGEPAAIKELLLDPPHSLAEQAWRPRRQRYGTMNVDGFGVGWYADGDPVPARYRRAGPIWADDALPDLARVTRTRAMLCAVRSATAGTDAGPAAAAPFGAGRWLFSHNGALAGWPDPTWPVPDGPVPDRLVPSGPVAGGPVPSEPVPSGSVPGGSAPSGPTPYGPAPSGPTPYGPVPDGPVFKLAAGLRVADLLGLQARCDAALIWAVVLARLRAGDGPADAVAGAVGDIAAAGASGRFNLLLTDGTVIAATAVGDSLCWRQLRGGVIVASEPSDDEPGWQDVPDQSVLRATEAGVTVKPLLLMSA